MDTNDNLKELIQTGKVNDSLVNDLYRDVLEIGDINFSDIQLAKITVKIPNSGI